MSGSWPRIAVLCLLTLPAMSLAHAQAGTYPDKPVTIISDAGAGSTVDVATRVIADGLAKVWGQNVAVVNRPGANGSIAAHAASDAAGNGYTLYTPATSTFLAPPTVAPNLPVKLPRDFIAVGFLADQPLFLAVDPHSGITTVQQLIDRAKKVPGTLSIAVSGAGRLTHLTSLLILQRAGIKLILVPYTGGPSAALADVAGGRVTMILEGYLGIIGAVNAGQIKLIATSAAKRLPEFANLPTLAETIPDLAAMGLIMMAAPLGTPAPIIAKISADLTKVLNDPDVRKRLTTTGSYPHAMTPDETLAFIAKLQEAWLPVVQSISTK